MALVFGLLAGLFAGVGAARAQVTIDVPTLVGFKAPITEGNRMVALVAGKEAKPSLLAGQVQVTEFRLETYRYAPERATELIVESPLGVFGPGGATSDRSILLRSADGRFSITGEGWSWDRGTGFLTISNRVQTSLRREGKSTNQPPIGVSSATFQYNLRTGDARFRGDCVASQPGRARISAGELSSRLTARSERPDTILATNGVTLEMLRPGQLGKASGPGATYVAGEDGEQITLAGPATWTFGPAEGGADELVLLPAKESYHARGHARLRLASLPRNTRGATNAPAASATEAPAVPANPANPAKKPASPPLEIAAEAIDSMPGQLVFTGPVTASQTGRLELRAEKVVADLNQERGTGRDSLTRVVASGDVDATLLGRGDPLHLRGREMIFTGGEHEIVTVEGDPSWETAGYTGTAGRFVIHPEVPTFQAVDRVAVRWLPRHGTAIATNRPPILLTADRLVAELDEARFRGSVRAVHPLWELRSGELDLRLATNATLREIAARDTVSLDYRLPLPRPRTNDTAAADPPLSGRNLAAALRSANPADRLWRIQAAEVTGAPVADGSGFDRLDATGGVRIDNPAAHAAGGRLSYRGADGLFRLVDDAWLKTSDGLEIIGERDTTIGFDPASNRFIVEGPVRRMVLPAGALREPASTNRPARR